MKNVTGRGAAGPVGLTLTLLALAIWRHGWTDQESVGTSRPRAPPELREQLERQRRKSPAALAAYRLSVAGSIEDLDAAVKPLLRQMPRVV